MRPIDRPGPTLPALQPLPPPDVARGERPALTSLPPSPAAAACATNCRQYLDPDPVLPVGAGGFEFAFEADDTLDVNGLKRLLIEEATSFRTEKLLQRRLRAERAVPVDLETHHHDDAAGGAKGGAGAVPAPMTEVKR